MLSLENKANGNPLQARHGVPVPQAAGQAAMKPVDAGQCERLDIVDKQALLMEESQCGCLQWRIYCSCTGRRDDIVVEEVQSRGSNQVYIYSKAATYTWNRLCA